MLQGGRVGGGGIGLEGGTASCPNVGFLALDRCLAHAVTWEKGKGRGRALS